MLAPKSTAAMRREYEASLCALSSGGDRSTIAQFDMYGWHSGLWVARETVPAFTALSNVCRAHNYTYDEVYGGTLVCRQITGGTNYSPHAYGIALDINPSRNPYVSYSGQPRSTWTDMPQAMVDDIKSIRTRQSNRQVFQWGGDWSTVKDAMHFQIGAYKHELAEGLDGPGTDGTTTTITTPTEGDPMFVGLKFDGRKSAQGEELQEWIWFIAQQFEKAGILTPEVADNILGPDGIDGQPGQDTYDGLFTVIFRDADKPAFNSAEGLTPHYAMQLSRRMAHATILSMGYPTSRDLNAQIKAAGSGGSGMTQADADRRFYPRAEADRTFVNEASLSVDVTVTDAD